MYGLRGLIPGVLSRLHRVALEGSDPPQEVAWLETFAISLLAAAAAWLISPHDPFFVQAEFPWLVLPSLFLALRHGFAFGFVGALLYLALMVAGWRYGVAGLEHFPSSLALGMLVSCMLAGEFSDLWRRRLGKMALENDQRERRMEEFTRSYHLLKVSHDQLVEHLAGASVSLRQAMAAIRNEMMERDRDGDPLELEAENILALFRRYGAVQAASLHRVGKTGLDSEPLARLGAVPEGLASLETSRIVAESLDTGEMMSVLEAENGSPRYVDGNILAVTPIRDLSGRNHAALIIYRIPFLKFTRENLSLIAVMGSYLGDLLHELEHRLQPEAEARQEFLAELRRNIHFARKFALHSHLVSMELAEASAVEELIRQRRSLDKVWLRRNRQGRPVLLWLMPFTDSYGVAGFQARIQVWAQQRFASEFSDDLLRIRVFPISGRHGAATVMEKLVHACDLAED
ncbi:MAG: hypothetical protein D6790_18695 [Caldilineae bacterium]|nr:MAG: hypothetical protein D6790_18695 [Caldilineae bacterium]